MTLVLVFDYYFIRAIRSALLC